MQEFINSYWQPALYSLLVFIVARLCNKLWIAVATMVIKQNLYEKALLAILYDRLFQSCQNYIAEKRISTEELKNLEHLYENYHRLGGNGTGTELYNRCRELPLKE